VLVGRPDWVLSQLPNSAHPAASQLQQSAAADAAAGKSTQVYVAVGDQLLGGLGFRDTLRQDAVETVAALKRMGLRVFLLSGDDTATVKAVAAQAGIAAGDAYGSNTPKQKLDVIRQLQVGYLVKCLALLVLNRCIYKHQRLCQQLYEHGSPGIGRHLLLLVWRIKNVDAQAQCLPARAVPCMVLWCWCLTRVAAAAGIRHEAGNGW
jgi:hypothetical protein